MFSTRDCDLQCFIQSLESMRKNCPKKMDRRNINGSAAGNLLNRFQCVKNVAARQPTEDGGTPPTAHVKEPFFECLSSQ